MKPVNCGCGGEAKVDWTVINDFYMAGVVCGNCGTKTIPFWHEEKDQAIDFAVTTWNKAMGGTEKSSIVERTAKVVNHDIKLMVVGYPNTISETLCGACKKKVLDGEEYCSHCGARLEWE